MTLFLLFLIFICSVSTATEIRCMVVNLEYVNCSWDAGGIPDKNLTFRSSYTAESRLEDCSSYLEVGEVRVGCVVSFNETKLERFSVLFASLYSNNGTVVARYQQALIKQVKLKPPCNLTVHMLDSELWFHWNSSTKTKTLCQDRQVRYRINHKGWKTLDVTTENSYNVPFPNAQNQYDFQVRVRMSATCGESELWSDWSQSVCWGSMTPSNNTETGTGMSGSLMLIYTFSATFVLILLACLLIHCERLRVILIPVVPRPKNLGDLLDRYNGNVEKWLHISKELQDGFKTNLSERPCAVREVRSQSESVVSCLSSRSSDYQPMLSYSSSSSPSSSSSLLSDDESQDLNDPHRV